MFPQIALVNVESAPIDTSVGSLLRQSTLEKRFKIYR